MSERDHGFTLVELVIVAQGADAAAIKAVEDDVKEKEQRKAQNPLLQYPPD